MQIIDGKQVASQVLEEVGRDIERLSEQGITPGLTVVLVGEDPASQVNGNSKGKSFCLPTPPRKNCCRWSVT